MFSLFSGKFTFYQSKNRFCFESGDAMTLLGNTQRNERDFHSQSGKSIFILPP